MDLVASLPPESRHLSVCRCCLKVDGVKDIFTECYDSGEREVFEELLKYTFDIQLFSHENQTKSLICEQCVFRLRDARVFKSMVLQSEEILKDYFNNLQFEDTKISPVKAEPIPEIHLDNPIIFDDVPAVDSFDDDEILSNVKQELTKAENVSLKRNHYTDKNTKCKRSKIKDDTIEKDWSKISERRGNGPLLRENSLKLIQNSTICVFQWNKSRYRCFCCKEPFSDINLLKEHTNNTHTLQNIEKKIILQQNRLVKVEISCLECKLCREKLESLSTLRSHLIEAHGRVIGENLLVPFRIEDELKCQICLENFSQFRLLNIHMNKHFQKQVCHICGAGFSNLVFLNLHKTRSHRPLSCKSCNITFNSKSDKKNHEITVHDVKFERKLRFPCPFCPQRFFQENFKVMHLVENHGMEKPEFCCDMCSKVFVTKSLVNNHMKNVHKKERKHECDVCHIFFYSKSDVARHRVSHTGEKKYSCNICNNLFASRDSLRRHMKRTHTHVVGNKSVFEYFEFFLYRVRVNHPYLHCTSLALHQFIGTQIFFI